MRTTPPLIGKASRSETRSWGPLEIAIGVFLVGVALVVVFAALSLFVQMFSDALDPADDDPIATLALILGQIIVDIIAVGIAATLSLRKYKLGPDAWSLRRSQPIDLRRCLGALVSAFAILIFYRLIVIGLGATVLEPESNVPTSLLQPRWILPFSALLIVVVAPVAEEIFFRGFVFNGLRRWRLPMSGPAGRGRVLGVTGAALLSGLMWAAIHGQIGLVIPIMLIGAVFAFLTVRTGSLWNAIAVHAAFNAIGFAVNLMSQTGA